MTTGITLFTIVVALIATFYAAFPIGGSVVMKAEGDGGSNGSDSGGWDFSNDDLPF